MAERKSDNCTPSPHGWTLDTLETHLSSKVDAVVILANEREAANKERSDSSKEAVTTAMTAQEKAISAAMDASEKAILKAEAAAEKRSEASNEIRAAMIDQQKNFADRVQTEFRFGSIDQRHEENFKSIVKRIDNLDNALSVASGKTQGVGVSTAFVVQIISSVASIGAILGVIIVLTRAH
jgi:HK97 family phage major capsid protein